MKLIKKLKITMLLCLVMMFGFACQELSLEPPQNISDDAFLASMQDFESALIGGYSQMAGASWYGRTMPLIADIMGEDVKQSSQANRYQEFADYEGAPTSGHSYEVALWREIYQAINMVNAVINSDFEPPSASTATFNQLRGEAYAVRALGLFDLARMYGQHYTFTAGASQPGVPVVLAFDVAGLPSRNTVAEVYTQLISDFTQGISLMTQVRSGPVLFTKEGAQALLSRVYLYMEDFTNSISMASVVINSGRFSLVSRANYVTQFVDGRSSEAILEIENTPTDNRGSNALSGMYGNWGYGDYLPSKDLLNLIDPDDIRLQMYLFDPDLNGIYASMRVNKWPSNTNDNNIPVIRLSEVYLNRAEAYARSGNDASARADLNLIRQRAFGDNDHDATSSGSALLAEILIERRIELANEGHRIFDITRYKQDLVRIDGDADTKLVAYPSPFFIFPIPFQELDTNPNMVQNAGYGG